MRASIVIDDDLMIEVMRATGMRTKREAVDLGLKTLLRECRHEEIRKMRGNLAWTGDLDAMRSDR